MIKIQCINRYLTPDVSWLFRYAAQIREGIQTPSTTPPTTYRRPLLGVVLSCDNVREIVMLKLSRANMSNVWSKYILEMLLRDKTTVVRRFIHLNSIHLNSIHLNSIHLNTHTGSSGLLACRTCRDRIVRTR